MNSTYRFTLRILSICMFIFAVAADVAARDIVKKSVSSPDGNLVFTFRQTADGAGVRTMTYTVDYMGVRVVEDSKLGVEVDNEIMENAMGIALDTCSRWCDDMHYKSVSYSKTDTVWKPVYGERAEVRDCCNAMKLSFIKGTDSIDNSSYSRLKSYFMNIDVRVYNEGVAFRYEFPETTNGLFLHLVDEETSFAMPEGTMAFYEQWAQAPFRLLPLSGWPGECERPLTMKLKNGMYVALAEACMVDFVRTKFVLHPEKKNTLKTSMYSVADVITPYAMPWRVIRVGRTASELANGNDIMLNLNPPTELEDVSWIRPGKVFRCGLSQKDGMSGIDFAAERGLQYIEFDAGWYGKEFLVESDASRVAENKDIDMKAICEYGQKKGIGVILYVNQRALSQQLDSILPIYKEWGVKGLKFGFVQVGNQYWTRWLHEAVKKCARYGIMVDIHDEYRPTGFSRTYPNLMTQEGIHGNECMPDAEHNTILPYTRFLAGAADYTLCYFNNRIKTTRAHQLAMAVVYYSPLQFMFWYDGPSSYKGEKELEFWKNVPTVWDDTHFVDGEPGKFAAVARRSGEKWFMGILNGLDARKVKIKTDFLEKERRYKAIIYNDDMALDTRTKVARSERKVKGGDELSFDLCKSGGTAVEFVEL